MGRSCLLGPCYGPASKDFGPGDRPRGSSDREVSLSRKGCSQRAERPHACGASSFHQERRRQRAVARKTASASELERKLAGARARARRGAGAAGRDRRGLAGHRQLARRLAAGVPDHAGERDPHLRGQVRRAVPMPRAMPFAWSRCTARRRRLPRSGERNPCFVPGRAPRSARAAATQADGSDRRRPGRTRLFRSRPEVPPPRRSPARRRADRACGPDAQGERAHRRLRHLSPGGAAVHRQADRADHEFR